jgi:RNA polymerase sigma-70 factor (ECF subfamily)
VSDVDDVLQEILVRVALGLADLRDEERFGPWVYQVARNAVVDHLRARARAPHTSEGEEATFDEDDAGVMTEAEQLLAPLVAPFVAALPSPYREALTLTELEGLTQREAASMMGISLSGMKSRVQRGRAKLRESFELCCRFELDARGRVIECTPRADGRLPEGCCS